MKKHVLLGKLFPVFILLHAVTSFSQVDVTVALGLACLVLAADFPGRRRRGKDWLKIHTVKAKVLVVLVLGHVFAQI